MYRTEPVTDYLDEALITVMQIHLTEPAGDILLFLTGTYLSPCHSSLDSTCLRRCVNTILFL